MRATVPDSARTDWAFFWIGWRKWVGEQIN